LFSGLARYYRRPDISGFIRKPDTIFLELYQGIIDFFRRPGQPGKKMSKFNLKNGSGCCFEPNWTISHLNAVEFKIFFFAF